MKFSYDSKIDAMYISFKEGKYDRTKKVTDEILVDVTKEGKVLGLEVLSASKNIAAFKPQSVTFNWESFFEERPTTRSAPV